MVEGTRVWIESQQKTISGEIIYLVPRSINVEITTPYSGVSTGLTIPYFACWFPSVRYFQADGKITFKGAETAERLLLELDRSCFCFDVNRKELTRAYLRLAGDIVAAASGIGDSEYIARRVTLRKRLRRHEISSIQYQQALKVLKKRVRKPPMVEFEAACGLSREVFERHGLRIPFGTVQQLVTKFLM